MMILFFRRRALSPSGKARRELAHHDESQTGRPGWRSFQKQSLAPGDDLQKSLAVLADSATECCWPTHWTAILQFF